MRPNTGLSPVCNIRGDRWVDNAACRTSDSPQIAVWGDSYAMHLVPGLKQLPIVQMTKSACAPADGITHVGGSHDEGKARECVEFNRSVLNALSANRKIKTVIISSAFTQILRDNGQKLLVGGRVSEYDEAPSRRAILSSVTQLRESGKRVIIVGPTPQAGFDAGQCNVRKDEQKPVFGRSDCNIPRAEINQENSEIEAMLRRVGAKTGASVFMPSDVLCGTEVCRTRIGSQLLYRDTGHLTPAGSELVMANLHKKHRRSG